jgi:hypothetical protein
MVFRKDFSMRQISSKIFLYLGLFLVIFLTPIVPAVQGKVAEVEETGDEEIVATREATYSENTADVVLAGAQKQKITSIYTGLAVSIAEDYLDVYEQADEQSEVAGRLYEENVAEVIEGDSEWTLIASGGLVGYVETAYLCFNEEAAAIGGDMTATVTSEYANVFTQAGLSDVIYTLANGDELNTLGMCGDYMLVETEAGEGYVVNADVALNYNLAFGKTTEEIEAEEEAAAEAARLAEEARQPRLRLQCRI